MNAVTYLMTKSYIYIYSKYITRRKRMKATGRSSGAFTTGY